MNRIEDPTSGMTYVEKCNAIFYYRLLLLLIIVNVFNFLLFLVLCHRFFTFDYHELGRHDTGTTTPLNYEVIRKINTSETVKYYYNL